tara:strand:+ start:1819 stop:1983 length:165 start_codon:yes stop_codon:yes gene_type:complete
MGKKEDRIKEIEAIIEESFRIVPEYSELETDLYFVRKNSQENKYREKKKDDTKK